MLQQSGKDVSGTACRWSWGFTCYSVQASGVHPFVGFVVRREDITSESWCADEPDVRWQGEVTSANEIVSVREPRIVYRRSTVAPDVACRVSVPPTSEKIR